MSQTVEVRSVLIAVAMTAGVLFIPPAVVSAGMWSQIKRDNYAYAAGSTSRFLKNGFLIYCNGKPDWLPFKHRKGIGNVVRNYRIVSCSE
jgi:hypothetical protein